jgi:hypothetical protein
MSKAVDPNVLLFLAAEAKNTRAQLKNLQDQKAFIEMQCVATEHKLAALVDKVIELGGNVAQTRWESEPATTPLEAHAIAHASQTATLTVSPTGSANGGAQRSARPDMPNIVAMGVRDAIRAVLKDAPPKGLKAREIADRLTKLSYQYNSKVPLASRVANDLFKMHAEGNVAKIDTAYVLPRTS